MAIETVTLLLNSYFSNPLGLLGLLALIPLIIFYLMKREPEEEMMPSFMFFHSEDETDSVKSAYRRLMRNLLLLLHVLAILGFAAAFADPYLDTAGTPEHSVLVLDRSGSMNGDLQDAKSFLKNNLGEKNTVIAVDNGAVIKAEEVPAGQARPLIENMELRETGTDIASGLEKAQLEKGKVFVASDLDQTVDSTDVEDIFSGFRASGIEYETMELERRNSWGIVDLEIGRENTTVEVKNFEARENTLTVTSEEEEKELTIEGGSVRPVTVKSSTGRNTVELPEDSFSPDNRAYFSIPEDDNFDITFIADSGNPYLMTVFELIEFTEIEYREPPLNGELDADMYIVGETDRMISESAAEIGSQVRAGADLVVFGHQDFENLGFENLPVTDRGDYVNRSVTLNRPVQISLGRTEIRDVNMTSGERLSTGSNALVKSDYGNGELLFYNIDDSVFNKEFMYPVFWKEISNDMLDRTPVEELNYRTGAEIERDSIKTPEGKQLSGRAELVKQGFYETSRGTVAVNMLNEDESLRDRIEVEPSPSDTGSSKSSIQHLVIGFLLLMIILETAYLYRIGDIQ